MDISSEAFARTDRRAAEHLEATWKAAQCETERIRAFLRCVRDSLQVFDSRVAALRKSRDASQASFTLTRRTAARCGLGNSPVTRANLSRLEAAMDQCRGAVVALIQEAEPACAEFDALYAIFQEARRMEREVLGRLQLQDAYRVPAAPEPPSPRVKQARERMAFLNDLEEKDRKRERSLPDEAHYDPAYSDWEILIRRSRPWV